MRVCVFVCLRVCVALSTGDIPTYINFPLMGFHPDQPARGAG